jgi:hypothetical protein
MVDRLKRTFKVLEVAPLFNKSVRTIQRYCDAYDIPKTNEGYLVSLEDLQSMGQYYYPKGDFPLPLLEFFNAEGVLHSTRQEIALEDAKRQRQGATVNDKKRATNVREIEINDAVQIVTSYATKQGLVPKFYTEEEYAELIGQLERLEVVEENTAELKEQIAYLRESNKELTSMLKEGLISVQKALTTLSERNTIEAGDKGLLK